jgi:hypothetical protein
MLFIVRGKNRNHEHSLRVNADSAQEAEAIGFKRGLFVTEVTAMENTSAVRSQLDRVASKLADAWKRATIPPMKAFGKVITNGQAAALLLCGVATWAVDLRTLVLTHWS